MQAGLGKSPTGWRPRGLRGRVGMRELILNAGGPCSPDRPSSSASESRQANPWPRSLLGHSWQGARRKGRGFRRGFREGRGPSFRKPRCVWGRGEESESGEPLPAPAPARLPHSSGVSLLSAWVSRASALGARIFCRWWELSSVLSSAFPTLLVTPPFRGWVVCRDHLGRGAHNLLLPALHLATQPGSYLPRLQPRAGQAHFSTWAQHL